MYGLAAFPWLRPLNVRRVLPNSTPTWCSTPYKMPRIPTKLHFSLRCTYWRVHSSGRYLSSLEFGLFGIASVVGARPASLNNHYRWVSSNNHKAFARKGLFRSPALGHAYPFRYKWYHWCSRRENMLFSSTASLPPSEICDVLCLSNKHSTHKFWFV